ncbi:MAG: OmpA family protein [Alphaproteobacteria bacterium]|nr:OmpA family protein [Alphaproteobacteria bacterium]
MNFRSALLAATVLAAPLAALLAAPTAANAQSQPISGLYVGAGAGVNFMQDLDINSRFTGATLPNGANLVGNRLSFNPGFVGLGSIGWGFGNGLRAELEGSYRNNSVDKFTNNGISNRSAPHAGGTEQKYGPMVNVLYDFNMVPYVAPYVGVGVGYQWAEWSNVRSFDNFGNQFTSNKTEGSFAVQAILGAAIPIPQVPGLALTAEYRFMALTGGRNYDGSFVTYGSLAPAGIPAGLYHGQARAQTDYNHSILLGVRYAFNAAPPPVVAAPAPAPVVQPARSYLVFFDWDKYNLTDRARQIIREAAENSTRVQYTRIQVNGYTDTSGTPKYNMGLSIRRANAVAAELVKNGVPRGSISIQGFGETHLLVPTGPGVREPQNRRVEIIIQ